MTQDEFDHLWYHCKGLQQAMFVITEVMSDNPEQAKRLREGFETFAAMSRKENAHVAQTLVLEGFAAKLDPLSRPKG